MKLNIANPARGLQKTISVENAIGMKFHNLKINDIFEGSLISPEFKGFKLKLTGGDDFQGIPMKTRVNTTKMVRLLLKKGEKGYRCRRAGVRRRKCVRGCIVSGEIAVLSCIIVAEGESIITGLNDAVVEQSHLPKRCDKLRRMFDIPEDVDLYAAVRKIISENSKEGEKTKTPRLRITRLNMEEKKNIKQQEKKERLRKREIMERERREYLAKYPEVAI